MESVSKLKKNKILKNRDLKARKQNPSNKLVGMILIIEKRFSSPNVSAKRKNFRNTDLGNSTIFRKGKSLGSLRSNN
jgi:hypothetical protein